MKADTLKLSDDDKILKEAVDRYEYGREVDGPNRKAARDDWDFAVNLNHWPADAKKARKGRPILTIDKLGTFLHQVTNDQRQNRPAIKIRPFDDKADKNTARVLQGLIRHIEYCSRAHIAYDTTYEHAVTCGIGFFRVLTKYKGKEANEQDIYIQRINNWDSVTLDPDHQEPDGSDAAWAFIEDEMDRDDFNATYKDAAAIDWSSLSSAQQKWIKKDKVKVAEYFKLVEKDGERKVLWYKLCGSKILDHKEWPGEHIPIIVVYGEERFIDGKRVYYGLVRRAKDPQRQYNYWASTYTELVTMAPKAKWVGTAKQFEGHESTWAGANISNDAYLPYNPDGQAPPPQRQGSAEVPQGVVQGLMQASEDIKATTGIFDASLGSRGNETSGKAIMARQREGDTANYHFLDNLTTSIQHLGRILIDLIPKIYDTARIVRILGEDGKEELVGINFPTRDQMPPDMLAQMQGIETVIHDLSIGKYDVVVDVGPAYATKRQEESDKLLSMLQSVPMIGQAAPDLIVGTLDVDKGDQIAERLRRALPPNLTQELGANGQPVQGTPSPELMQAQQELQAMQQQMAEMAEALKEAQSGVVEKTIERETKLQEAEIKRQTELAKAGAAVEVAQIEAQTARIQAIPDPAIQEAEDMKTQQVMEQLAAMLAQSTQQQSIALSAVVAAQAQSNQVQQEILKLLATPKQVVIQRGADGRIESAASVPMRPQEDLEPALEAV